MSCAAVTASVTVTQMIAMASASLCRFISAHDYSSHSSLVAMTAMLRTERIETETNDWCLSEQLHETIDSAKIICLAERLRSAVHNMTSQFRHLWC